LQRVVEREGPGRNHRTGIKAGLAMAGRHIGINSASARANARVDVEENAMTDPNSRDTNDLVDPGDTTTRDPDRHSTWNTIDGTVDVDEVLDEDDFENFFIEPVPDPLNPAAPSDDPGATS
jgi:hypothetical protein